MDYFDLGAYQSYGIFFGLFLLIYPIYFLVKAKIRNTNLKNDQKRRLISNAKALYFIVMAAVFLYLWANELQNFMLSIAAIMAAMAIAFKELFLCFAGSFYRTFAHPFTVGDRIQVMDYRGDVVIIGMLSTKILEVGPKHYTHQYTGRMLSIPNSLFITHAVLNETDDVHDDDRDYALHVFTVPVRNNKNWQRHYDTILECADKICHEHIIPAQHYFTQLALKRHVDAPFIEPRINVNVIDSDEIELIVRVTVPVAMKGIIEQEIIKAYLNIIHKVPM